MENKKILWVSMMAPYDGVPHAGGKIENYYIKALGENKNFDVTLVSLYKPDEISKLNIQDYGIDSRIGVRPRGGLINETKRGYAWLSKNFVWNKYAGLTPHDIHVGLRSLLLELKREGFCPDLIILQWTEVLFMLPEVKRLWPDCKYIAIEEDVSFLGISRRYESSHFGIKRLLMGIKKEKVKNLEIKYLNSCDLTIINNLKDLKLVVDNGLVGDSWVWAPFYQSMIDIEPKCSSKDIVFYGALFREENWKSAIWFIENVLPILEDKETRFVLIGGNPPERLKRYASERVIFTGYVDDVAVAMSGALCLVAPLLLGAGIKIKVLEALSLGIPVLTNDIGIEGIDACDGSDFFLCNVPDDYKKKIEMLISNPLVADEIKNNAKAYMKKRFDFTKDREVFVEKVQGLLQ